MPEIYFQVIQGGKVSIYKHTQLKRGYNKAMMVNINTGGNKLRANENSLY